MESVNKGRIRRMYISINRAAEAAEAAAEVWAVMTPEEKKLAKSDIWETPTQLLEELEEWAGSLEQELHEPGAH